MRYKGDAAYAWRAGPILRNGEKRGTGAALHRGHTRACRAAHLCSPVEGTKPPFRSRSSAITIPHYLGGDVNPFFFSASLAFFSSSVFA